jgi:hypothetical protein
MSTFKVVEHHSGMFAVIDTRTGDTAHLYADEASAQRVAEKSNAVVDHSPTCKEDD